MFIPIMEQVISFKGLHLPFQRGKCVALLGRNGAGKTTTIHTISGLVKSKRGTITFNDKQVQALPTHQISRDGIGLVPQGEEYFLPFH